MSQIKQHLLGKLEEAEALSYEIDGRYRILTEDWKIEDPEIIVNVLSEPLSRLAGIWDELVMLGGRTIAARIPLSKEIIITVLKTKTWQSVQNWYDERGLELDITYDDFVALLQYPSGHPGKNT